MGPHLLRVRVSFQLICSLRRTLERLRVKHGGQRALLEERSAVSKGVGEKGSLTRGETCTCRGALSL